MSVFLLPFLHLAAILLMLITRRRPLTRKWVHGCIGASLLIGSIGWLAWVLHSQLVLSIRLSPGTLGTFYRLQPGLEGDPVGLLMMLCWSAVWFSLSLSEPNQDLRTGIYLHFSAFLLSLAYLADSLWLFWLLTAGFGIWEWIGWLIGIEQERRLRQIPGMALKWLGLFLLGFAVLVLFRRLNTLRLDVLPDLMATIAGLIQGRFLALLGLLVASGSVLIYAGAALSARLRRHVGLQEAGWIMIALSFGARAFPVYSFSDVGGFVLMVAGLLAGLACLLWAARAENAPEAWAAWMLAQAGMILFGMGAGAPGLALTYGLTAVVVAFVLPFLWRGRRLPGTGIDRVLLLMGLAAWVGFPPFLGFWVGSRIGWRVLEAALGQPRYWMAWLPGGLFIVAHSALGMAWAQVAWRWCNQHLSRETALAVIGKRLFLAVAVVMLFLLWPIGTDLPRENGTLITILEARWSWLSKPQGWDQAMVDLGENGIVKRARIEHRGWATAFGVEPKAEEMDDAEVIEGEQLVRWFGGEYFGISRFFWVQMVLWCLAALTGCWMGSRWFKSKIEVWLHGM